MTAAHRFLPLFLALASSAAASPEDFHAGSAIPAFGKVVSVASDMPLPADAVWKHTFDVSEGKRGQLNTGLESAARFVNMMVDAGVPKKRLKVAVVVHGSPVLDVSNAARYAAQYGKAENPNAKLVAALLDAGVEIWVCGQSAAAQDVAKTDLQPGVKMALSAITAHAELQRQGYSLNPF